jgi:hypothetical protein
MHFEFLEFIQKIEELPASPLQTEIVIWAGKLADKYMWTNDDMKTAYRAGQAASEITATFTLDPVAWITKYSLDSKNHTIIP